MRARNGLIAWSLIVAVSLGFSSCVIAQAPDPTQAPQSSQVVSQTGLLPVYGVDLFIDPAWVDGSAFPSTSPQFPNQGVSAGLQQLWDAIKPSGLNCVRFVVDVRDAKSWAVRTANLCSWASANGVRLVPVLAGSYDSGFSKNSAEFVKTLASSLKADAQYLPLYSQILSFQIGNRLNKVGSGSSTLLLKTASELRAAETAVLSGSGVYATPIMANMSFDSELVKAKSMAGVILSQPSYDEACRSAGQFLKQLVSAQDIDIFDLEWLPGSIGAGSVDKLPELLKSLQSDIGGKQVAFTTGFSTAFNPAADQKQYYAAAFTNLVQYRAQESVSGSFLGVFFRNATDSLTPAPTPPTPDLPNQVAQWDRAAKSAELASMWSGGATSADLEWWLAKTEAHLGIFSASADPAGTPVFAPQSGFEALLQIAGVVTEANTAMASDPALTGDPNAAAPATGDPFGTSGATGTSFKSKVKEGLLGLVDKVFQKIGDKIMAAGTGTGTGAGTGMDWTTPAATTTMDPGLAPGTTGAAAPAVLIGLAASDVSFSPTSPKVGEAVTANVTIHNQSTSTEATGLSVAIVDSSGFVVDAGAQQGGLSVPQSGTKTVSLSWTPTTAGTLSLAADVYDSFLFKAATVPLSLTVAPASGGSAPAAQTSSSSPTGGIECSKSDISITPASPQASALAKVSINLHNTGSSDLSGIDVLLVDTQADPSTALLGEIDGNSIAKNGQKKVEINWTPSADKNYELAIQIWQGYSAMLLETKLDPVTVAAAPSGQGSATPAGVFAVEQVTVQPSGPKASQQATFKVGMKNNSASDVSNVDVFLVNTTDPGLALAQASSSQVGTGAAKSVDLSWTPDAEGQYALEVQAWDMAGMLASKAVDVTVAAGTSGSGGTVHAPDRKVIPSGILRPGPLDDLGPIVSTIPPGLPDLMDLIIGFGSESGYGSSAPVKFNLVNKYSKSVGQLSVALMADGKKIETRSLGTMIPGQTRSVEFAGLPLSGAGKHTVKIMLSGNAGKQLSGSVQQEINVSTRALATAGATVLTKRPKLGVSLPTGRKSASTVRVVVPPVFNIGGKQFASNAPSVPRVMSASMQTGTGTKLPATAATKTPPRTLSNGSTSTTQTPPTMAIPGVRPTIAATSTATGAATSTTAIPGTTRPTGTVIPGVTPTTTPTTGTVRATLPTTKTTVPTTTPTATPSLAPVTGTVRATIPNISTTTPTVTPTPSPTTTPTLSPTTTPTRATTIPGITSPTTTAPTAATTPVVKPTTGVVVPNITPAVTPTTTPTLTPSTTPTVKPTTGTVSPVTSTATVVTRSLPTVKPDLSVSSAGIRCTPSPPKAGEMVTFSVSVRNLAAAVADGTKLLLVLKADGAPLGRREFTINVAASGFASQQWQLTTPRAKQLTLDVSVMHSADTATANNQASLIVATATTR